MSTQRYYQEDQTPQADTLANEIGIAEAELAEVNRKITLCAGYPCGRNDPLVQEAEALEATIYSLKMEYASLNTCSFWWDCK